MFIWCFISLFWREMCFSFYLFPPFPPFVFFIRFSSVAARSFHRSYTGVRFPVIRDVTADVYIVRRRARASRRRAFVHQSPIDGAQNAKPESAGSVPALAGPAITCSVFTGSERSFLRRTRRAKLSVDAL